MEEPLQGEASKVKDSRKPLMAPEPGSWVDRLPKTDHVNFFRSVDFSKSPLGPKSTWCSALRRYVGMAMIDSRPACVYWGSDRVAIYNEAFIPLISGNHPRMMGKPLKEALPEAWKELCPLLDHAQATQTTLDMANMALDVTRHGLREECYFDGQHIPIPGDTGEIEGLYNSAFESTSMVLHERHRKVVELIASIPIGPIDATCAQIMSSLRTNPTDVPMAILYSYDELAPMGSNNLTLCGSVGIPREHPCTPEEAHLDSASTGVIPFLREALNTEALVIISRENTESNDFETVFSSIDWAGHGIPSPKVLVLALSSGKRRVGFYIQGINPRRPYDHGVELSIVDIARQIEARWAASITNEENKRREEILERKLTDSERQLRLMAQSAPLGMCRITPDGGIFQWANDNFYEITGMSKDKTSTADLFECILPEDKAKAELDLAVMTIGETRISSELRLKRRWSPPPYVSP